VQNKMHWAAHSHTAAEVVAQRANAEQPNMGLTTWKNAPGGPVRSGDVAIAKNYLRQEELEALNLITSAYLDFAELQARNHRPMHMADWIAKLDSFLRLSDQDILSHAGTISHQAAAEHAHEEFRKYDQERRRIGEQRGSDFDRAVENVKKLKLPKRANPCTRRDQEGGDER
jgi:hypothetical protein